VLERAVSDLDAPAEQQEEAESEAQAEPAWAVEARAMLSRLQSGG
jgi:hypothetical protein